MGPGLCFRLFGRSFNLMEPEGFLLFFTLFFQLPAFLFLTPRDWFRDQPRIHNARSIAMLPSENGSSAFWIDKELLGDTPEKQQTAKLTEPLRALTGNRHLSVTRVEEVRGSEDELLGYMAFARP